ncbi:MAG: hypothetical protein V1929_12720, partial [bacterium]
SAMRYGLGDGVLCQINGTVAIAGTTVVVDNPGTKWLAKGMRLACLTERTTPTINTGHTNLGVGSVTDGTTFELAAALATTEMTDNYFLAPSLARVSGATTTYVPQGLMAICDDGTNCATFQGLARASYPEIKGILDNGGSVYRNPSKNMVELAMARAMIIQGKTPSTIIGHPGIMVKWRQALESKENFPTQGVSQEMGKLPLRYGGKSITIIEDRWCLDRDIFIVKTGDIDRLVWKEFAWDKEDGAVLRRAGDGTLSYSADYFGWETLGCQDPRGMIRVGYINNDLKEIHSW